MLERKVFKVLDRWKKEKNHLPIIIKGLRQVGKTTSVIEFAKQNYENAFFLDFRSFIELRLVFSGNFDIDEILLKLSLYKARLSIINGSDFIPYKTVFIFFSHKYRNYQRTVRSSRQRLFPHFGHLVKTLYLLAQ